MLRIPHVVTTVIRAAARAAPVHRLVGRHAHPATETRRAGAGRGPTSGPPATADRAGVVEAGRVRAVTTYTPERDGDPDPGEVVWTWVPFEDDPSQGKDRPVLIVARADADLLGLQLTSRDRAGDPAWLPVGSGDWDAEGRASWARLDRVLRVPPAAMRREGAQLPRSRFEAVAARLRERYGWQ